MYLHQSLQAWESVIAVLHFLYSSEVDMSINVHNCALDNVCVCVCMHVLVYITQFGRLTHG